MFFFPPPPPLQGPRVMRFARRAAEMTVVRRKEERKSQPFYISFGEARVTSPKTSAEKAISYNYNDYLVTKGNWGPYYPSSDNNPSSIPKR